MLIRFLAAAGALAAMMSSALAQELPRTASGRPDLQGIWQVSNRASVDIEDHAARWGMPAGRSVVDGGEVPYQDWARERQRENFRNRATADPLNNCYLPGTPRIMYMP